MSVRRYKWSGNFTVAELQGQIPPAFTPSIKETNPVYTDIEVLPNPVSADANEDLDAFMATLGWTFDSLDPTVQLPTCSAQLTFGCESISATDTVRYLPSGWDDNIATTSPYTVQATRAGTLRNLRVKQNMPAGNGNPVHYTLLVNGAPTALVAILLSTDLVGADLDPAHAVSVNSGDDLDLQITKPSGSLQSAPNDVTATMEFL